jgi:hypothetical protein
MRTFASSPIDMQIRPAKRFKVPLIISLDGPSGSGKTYSALLLAAGLAGPKGVVGFLDTENGRGCMYVDSPGIKAALPNGYQYGELAAPFSPARYIEAIDAFERHGCAVLVIDSGSHEWEGVGSCSEMAAEDKNKWNRAKREHKKYVQRMLNAKMDIIVCLRAREKEKIIDKANSPDGKEQHIPLGIQPVAEKNFVFEMILSFRVEDVTHLARPVKVPEQFATMFPKPRLLTKADGEAIRLWNEGGTALDETEQLKRQARAAANEGMDRYKDFFSALPKPQQKILADTTHAENKGIAELIDREKAEAAAEPSDANEELSDERFRELSNQFAKERAAQ